MTNKFLIVVILFSLPAFAAEMTQMEKNTIDRYIATSLHGGLTPREHAVNEFLDRANHLDADINPLLAICQRGDDMLKEEGVYIENAEKNMAQGYFRINSYDDKNFKQSTMRSMRELCCTIKTDPDWSAHIQERVARGLEPLESNSNQAPNMNRQAVGPNGPRQGPQRGGGGGQGRGRGQGMGPGMGPGMRRGFGPGAQGGPGAGRGMRRGQGQNQQQ